MLVRGDRFARWRESQDSRRGPLTPKLLSLLGDLGLSRSDEDEWLDQEPRSRELLLGNLQDIARINRLLGGSRLTVRAVDRAARHLDHRRMLTVLDVGTGIGDIPLAITKWAGRRGRALHVTAIDRSSDIVAIASSQPGAEGVRLEAGDVEELCYPAASFDIVMCSLLLHHLTPDKAVLALREMARVARRAVIVNDLVRNRIGYWGSRVLTPMLTSNQQTRHDAPLSIKRAYTCEEILELVRSAGLVPVRLDHVLYHRIALTAHHPAT